MEAIIMDKTFASVDLIDSFSSFIWSDRYQEAGDFELQIPMDAFERLRYVQAGNYMYNKNSEHLMIICSFLVTTTALGAKVIKITGRSLESILARRIIWDPTTLTGNFQNAVQKLLNEAIISPKEPQRKIDNFVFKASTDPRITALTIDGVYEERENLYDTIVAMCKDKDVGWKVLLNASNQFEFSLYKGIDRSYDQNDVPWVVFSPRFENLVNTEYLVNIDDYLNVCLVTGEDSDNQVDDKPAPILWTVVGHHVGLNRYETYAYAGSLTSDEEPDAEGNRPTLTPAEKQSMMEQAGKEELADHKKIVSLTGEVDPYSMFTYGNDYGMGDHVQIENEYGLKGTSTISEFTMSHDVNGYITYPTFTDFEQEEEEE